MINVTYITYYYECHKDNKRIEKKYMHIDQNFKIVRYYVIYAKTHKHSDMIFEL